MSPAVDRHTGWCSGGHRCGLGEHRTHPVILANHGAGHATLTRVRTPDGRQHAEIRLCIPLPPGDPAARRALLALLARLDRLLSHTLSPTDRRTPA